MPLYDFYCLDCMKYYEIIIPLDRFDEDVLCPHCNKKLNREIKPVLFRIR